MKSPPYYVTKQLHEEYNYATKRLQQSRKGKEQKMLEKHKITYLKDIKEILNLQKMADATQYGERAIVDNNSFMKRQEEAKERLVKSLQSQNFNSEEIVKVFEQYGEILQAIYFEMGVQIGICMQSEILKNEKVEKKKRMTLEEFKDRIFDMINESNTIMICDLEVEKESRDIFVFLQDGSQFAVRCEEK